MTLVAIGVALVILGVMLTFSSLLGLTVGAPLVAIGISVAALGSVLWVAGGIARAARPRGL
ncbi:MAG TPA: hypothetical protein VI997_08185 [Candidatus Thermoplasmatota archaeon]|nr:hypothetical protein [Candidatus Thermoplasmatota archaeon]